jgi:hypothetical protein
MKLLILCRNIVKITIFLWTKRLLYIRYVALLGNVHIVKENVRRLDTIDYIISYVVILVYARNTCVFTVLTSKQFQ